MDQRPDLQRLRCDRDSRRLRCTPSPDGPRLRPRLRFQRALQGPTMEMRLRGVLVDQVRKQEVIDELVEKIDILEGQLERIVLDGVGMPSFNWRSNDDLQRLFYSELGLSTETFHGRPTTNRAAPESLA